MCTDVQSIGALNYLNPRIKDNECISCGQCITVCPTDALSSTDSKPSILRAISERKIMVLQMAPAARVAIGEGFGKPPGTVCTGKIIQAARQIGFKYVFDTNFGADVTVIEEGNELLHRMGIKVDASINSNPIINNNSPIIGDGDEINSECPITENSNPKQLRRSDVGINRSASNLNVSSLPMLKSPSSIMNNQSPASPLSRRRYGSNQSIPALVSPRVRTSLLVSPESDSK